jgi:hypothetical protein
MYQFSGILYEFECILGLLLHVFWCFVFGCWPFYLAALVWTLEDFTSLLFFVTFSFFSLLVGIVSSINKFADSKKNNLVVYI